MSFLIHMDNTRGDTQGVHHRERGYVTVSLFIYYVYCWRVNICTQKEVA